MSDIKIFVTHTPNRNTMRIEGQPLLYNVIAGSDFQTEKIPKGVYLDNQGDNISKKNKSYCELTTQYWAWKNMEADYYGFCHYRRFFSFNSREIGQSCWGTIEYDYLDERALQELKLNEHDMRSVIERYDFLIARGVEASAMQADTIYNHYDNAQELYIRDVEIFLQIIKEKYPHMYETADAFFQGHIFYPCNMFIMKKELFQEYSSILFDVLEEFEKRADMRNYSREGFRTTGHLGERMAGIYYLYMKNQKKYKTGEIQIALFHHAEEPQTVQIGHPDIVTAVQNQAYVPVVLAANQAYVPILYTCVQSIVDHASDSRIYEIFIFHTDIQAQSQEVFLKNLVQCNIHIQFMNVMQYVEGYRLQAKQHITTETFYRFLALQILKDIKKAVYLDCDMVICRDIAELFDTDLGGHLIAAVRDADFAGQCNRKHSEMMEYCKKVLHMEDASAYFQAGVLVMNIEGLNKVTSVRELFEMSDTGIYRFSDQDILNIVCKGRVVYLDMKWNVLFDCGHSRWKDVVKYAPYYILDEYEAARKQPYIIHYAGWLKPWMSPDEDFAAEFWKTAARTVFYEVLLRGMMEYTAENIIHSYMQVHVPAVAEDVQQREHVFLEKLRKIARHCFPKDTRIRAWAVRVYLRMAK